MKNKLLVLLLALVMLISVFSMASCGDEENPDDTSDTSSGTDTTEDSGLNNDNVQTGDCDECTYLDWTVVLAPTCTEKGCKVRVCEACYGVESQILEPTGHTCDSWTYLNDLKAPTCTEKVVKTGTCKVCKLTVGEEIPALGHNLDVLEASAPTATMDGWTRGEYCFTCRKQLKDSIYIPSLQTATFENIASKGTWYPSSEKHGFAVDENGRYQLVELKSDENGKFIVGGENAGYHGQVNYSYLWDGDLEVGTYIAKRAITPIFVQYENDRYVTDITINCNGKGTLPSSYSTKYNETLYRIKKITVMCEDSLGNVIFEQELNTENKQTVTVSINKLVSEITFVVESNQAWDIPIWEIDIQGAKYSNED